MSMLTIIVIIIGILLAIFLIIGVYCCCKVASKDEMRDKIMIQYLEDLVFNNKEDKDNNDDEKDE